MTPVTSKTDSTSTKLGDVSAFSITSGAIPLSVNDSAGSITALKGTWVSDDGDTEMLIGQQLTLTDPAAGTVQGKVVAVNKTMKRHRTAPYNNPSVQSSSVKALTEKVTLDVNTFMDGLTTNQRCYPIYHSSGVDNYTVSNAVDHWTQTAGLFYDAVPGVPLQYHSFHGHDYIWCRNNSIPGRASNFSANGPDAPYNVVNGRVMQYVDNAYAGVHLDQPGAAWQADGFYQLGVPTNAEGNTLVFSLGIDMEGTSHSGALTINTRSAIQTVSGTYIDLQVTYNTATGFALYKREYTDPNSPGSYTQLLANLGTAVSGHYRIYVGVKEAAAAGQSIFTLHVVNSANNTVLDDRSVTVNSALRGKQAGIVGGNISPNSGGSGTMISVYGWFISLISGALPTASLPKQKSLGQSPYAVQIVPGFSGSVWDNIKTALALHRMDCWYEDNLLKTGPRDTTVRYSPDFHSISTTVRIAQEARNIEVVSYNYTAAYSVPTVFFSATTVYQVATGQTQTFTVQSDHSIDRVFNPNCVSGISPYPYTSGSGQYVITGSDGYIVSPQWWSDNGGKITAAPTGNEGEIQITIKGPDTDSVRSPYRVSEGDAGRPALYISGTGLQANKETLTIPTGNPKAAQDVGTTADFKFITSRKLAYDAASMISLDYATPDVQFKLSEAKQFNQTAVLGRKTAGALVKHNGSIYLVTQATQTHSQISADTAIPYNTIQAINDSFNSATIGTMNTFYNNKTIKDVSLKPLNRLANNA